MANEKQAISPPRHRSPNYPSFNLEEAIAKTRTFEKTQRLNPVPVEIAVQTLGYKKKNSDGFRAVATLLNFGLLEAQGSGANRRVRLSPLGERIVTDPRAVSPERDAAIQEAALKPDVHKKLWDKHKQRGIPTDDVIAYELQNELNFNRDVISAVVQEYKDTLKYAKLSDNVGKSDGTADDGGKGDDGGIPERKKRHMQGSSANVTMKDYPIPLDDKRDAMISIPSNFSQEDLDSLSDWVKYFGKRLISKGQEKPDEDIGDGE